MGYGNNTKAFVEEKPMSVGVHENVILKDVKAYKTEPNTQSKTFDVLDFRFENEKGEFHTVKLFSPENQTDPTKKNKAEVAVSNTLAYIAYKLTGQQKDIEGEGINSWKDFTDYAIKFIGEDFSTKFKLKLVGNVYKNRAYLNNASSGWLEPMNSNVDLKFTKNEEKSNLEYDLYFKTPTNVSTNNQQASNPLINPNSSSNNDLPF